MSPLARLIAFRRAINPELGKKGGDLLRNVRGAGRAMSRGDFDTADMLQAKREPLMDLLFAKGGDSGSMAYNQGIRSDIEDLIDLFMNADRRGGR